VLKKWYTSYKDHIKLSDYEIHNGMSLELYYVWPLTPFKGLADGCRVRESTRWWALDSVALLSGVMVFSTLAESILYHVMNGISCSSFTFLPSIRPILCPFLLSPESVPDTEFDCLGISDTEYWKFLLGQIYARPIGRIRGRLQRNFLQFFSSLDYFVWKLHREVLSNTRVNVCDLLSFWT
jgi:hypothetical protein